MTVSELIARLQEFDGDLPVAIVNYPYIPYAVQFVHLATDKEMVGDNGEVTRAPRCVLLRDEEDPPDDSPAP